LRVNTISDTVTTRLNVAYPNRYRRYFGELFRGPACARDVERWVCAWLLMPQRSGSRTCTLNPWRWPGKHTCSCHSAVARAHAHPDAHWFEHITVLSQVAGFPGGWAIPRARMCYCGGSLPHALGHATATARHAAPRAPSILAPCAWLAFPCCVCDAGAEAKPPRPHTAAATGLA